nr:15408_t:CDS:2 [Entrophospora candida]
MTKKNTYNPDMVQEKEAEIGKGINEGKNNKRIMIPVEGSEYDEDQVVRRKVVIKDLKFLKYEKEYMTRSTNESNWTRAGYNGSLANVVNKAVKKIQKTSISNT